MKNVIVFGANSYIGLNLVFDFLASGKYRVIALDTNFSNPLWTEIGENPELKKYHINIMEIDSYSNLPIWQSADHLISLVSTSKSSTFDKLPYQEIRNNLVPYATFFEFLQDNFSGHFVYFSSGGTVYGEPKERAPIPEDSNCEPISAYGMGKRMIELLTMKMAHVSRFDYTILRLSNPVGRFQNITYQQGIFPAVKSSIDEGKEFSVFGDGHMVRDYFDVRQISIGIDLIFENPGAWNNIYNFGSGSGLSVSQLLGLVKQVVGAELRIQYQPTRGFDVGYNVLDCSKLEKAIGWKPNPDIGDAIKLYFSV